MAGVSTLDRGAIERLRFDPLRRQDFTVVIPVAGKGSRLGYDEGPKALYPVAGRPILEWLFRLFEPYADRLVLVVSPAHRAQIEAFVTSTFPTSEVAYVVQEEPLGMAHALWVCRKAVTSRNTVVVWGDQIGLTPGTVELTLQSHQHFPHSKLTLPTCMKQKPYIAIDRDDSGVMLRVRQAREGEIHEERGENDCGLFVFQSQPIFALLDWAVEQRGLRGAKTGEINLLPLLPKLEDTLSLQIASEEETLGVNTPIEAQYLGEILRKRES